MAIIEKLDNGQLSFTYDELLNEMITYAWYMVSEYHLRLGPIGSTDNLEEVVKYIKDKYGFSSSEKREKIIGFLLSTDDKKIQDYKNKLTLNVPYRLQSPFYDDINIQRTEWHAIESLSQKINAQKRLIYYFDYIAGTKSVVRVDETWAAYLKKHKEILINWTQFNLIKYLQRRNPGVSGIADKIEAPTSRNLNDIRKYWKLIISKDSSIRDIYGNVELVDEKLSIDHFVPWQYVAHDELWNLHPTIASINSKKSNNLPSWDKYFDKLSILEYKAYDLIWTDKEIKKIYDSVADSHLNDLTIRSSLYEKGLNISDYQTRLEKIIKPVYDSALSHGFKVWVYGN